MSQGQAGERVHASVCAASPHEEPAGMEAEAALLQQFASVPALTRAHCVADGEQLNVQLFFSQRDLSANSQRKYCCSASVDTKQLQPGTALTVGSSAPVEMRDVQLYAPSPSGARLLVVRGGGEGTSVVLEVWQGQALLHALHVPSALHGSVYNDGWFGLGAAWSRDEERVAYVAENPAVVQTPQWGAPQNSGGQQGGQAGGDDKQQVPAKEGAAPKSWRGVGEWQEDWGELNVGKKPPALFVLDVAPGRVTPVTGLPADTSCGQPVWTPQGDGLVFVAWPHTPTNFGAMVQRLGVVYCFNRPAQLWAIPWAGADADPQAVCLTPELPHACSPAFSPSGATLLALSCKAAVTSGVHNATAAMVKLEWKGMCEATTGTLRTVVEVVQRADGADSFPGLYAATFIQQPFIDEEHVALTSQWRSDSAVLRVSVNTGAVARMTPPGASWTLHSLAAGVVTAVRSKCNEPYQLLLARAEAACETWGWVPLSLKHAAAPPQAVADALEQMACTVLQVTPSVAPLDISLECLVLHRPDAQGSAPAPAVLVPHGGPHAAATSAWMMPLAFLTALGYNVLLVNFRGSTGYGEASLQSLPGAIGTNDVADCMAALQAAVDAGLADPARVAIMGGSHGGFLTGNLVGQHPSTFRCGIMRNPVCDISAMVHVSDIPDWCYIEAFGTQIGRERMKQTPDAEDLRRFAQVSPIAHVSRVSAPLLLMLGAKDMRVPLVDGKRYAWALRAHGVTARVIVYPEDTHALDRPQTEFEQYVTAAWWLKQYNSARADC